MRLGEQGQPLPSGLLSTPVLQTEPGCDIQSLSAGQLLIFPAEIWPVDFPAFGRRLWMIRVELWSLMLGIENTISVIFSWPRILQMISYPVTLCQPFAQIQQPVATERNIISQLMCCTLRRHISSLFKCNKLNESKQNLTSFSRSLILLLFCLDLIFSCSISAVSSLFFLDSSTIFVAATAPAKPDVPKWM